MKSSLARAKAIPTPCDKGPVSYSKSQTNHLPIEYWDGTWTAPLTMLGKVTMYITAFERKFWRCERCCTRDGDLLKVTWWHADANVDFTMADAFTNPTFEPASDPWFPAYQQGRCVQACLEEHGLFGTGFVGCRDACRVKYPTNNDEGGIPYGIFHAFSRKAFDSDEIPCGSQWR